MAWDFPRRLGEPPFVSYWTDLTISYVFKLISNFFITSKLLKHLVLNVKTICFRISNCISFY